MTHSFEVGTKISFSFPALLEHFVDPRKDIETLLLRAVLKMEQTVYRRISDNIYKTLQEHKEASLDLQKVQKGKNFFEKMQNNRRDPIFFSRMVAQLN